MGIGLGQSGDGRRRNGSKATGTWQVRQRLGEIGRDRGAARRNERRQKRRREEKREEEKRWATGRVEAGAADGRRKGVVALRVSHGRLERRQSIDRCARDERHGDGRDEGRGKGRGHRVGAKVGTWRSEKRRPRTPRGRSIVARYALQKKKKKTPRRARPSASRQPRGAVWASGRAADEIRLPALAPRVRSVAP